MCVNYLRIIREKSLGGPVAFASRLNSNELNDEDLEAEAVGLRARHLPSVSCAAAKAIVCIGGVAAVGR